MGRFGGGMWGIFPIPAYGGYSYYLGIASLKGKSNWGAVSNLTAPQNSGGQMGSVESQKWIRSRLWPVPYP